MDLKAEMEDAFQQWRDMCFRKLPPGAMSVGAGLEISSPALYLSLMAPAYALAGKYVEDAPVQILECGCGTGYGTFCLGKVLPQGSSITGTDTVPELVAYANANHARPGVLFRRADATDLSFESESIDMVLAVFAIVQDMTRSETKCCLSEIARVLKPGGQLVFTTPNRELSQDLYHENPDDDPKLRFSHLNIHEYYGGEVKDLLEGMADEGEAIFTGVEVHSLTNAVFRPLWIETIGDMRQKRFDEHGLSSLPSALARRLLPASAKVRFFMNALRKRSEAAHVTLRDMALGAEIHTEDEGVQADHFVVRAQKPC